MRNELHKKMPYFYLLWVPKRPRLDCKLGNECLCGIRSGTWGCLPVLIAI